MTMQRWSGKLVANRELAEHSSRCGKPVTYNPRAIEEGVALRRQKADAERTDATPRRGYRRRKMAMAKGGRNSV